METQFSRLGLPDPRLSVTQAAMRVTKWVNFLSQVVGIVIGCIIGMLPLLWIDDVEKTAKKVFACLDATGDGYIHVEELQAAVKFLGLPQEASKELVSHVLQRADYKHDSRISQAEFVDFAREVYREVLAGELELRLRTNKQE